MNRLSKLKPLLEPLNALQKLMRKSGCPWMIIGGVAASILGKPRFTADVDAVALIDDKEISALLKRAKELGFGPRVKNPVEFAKRNGVLLFKHTKSGINLDLSLGILPFEKEAINKSKPFKIGKVIFYLPRPEDLIIFKAVAHRPQDIQDIREIVTVNPKVDKKYIKKVIKQFARALETPEMWNDVENIIG